MSDRRNDGLGGTYVAAVPSLDNPATVYDREGYPLEQVGTDMPGRPVLRDRQGVIYTLTIV